MCYQRWKWNHMWALAIGCILSYCSVSFVSNVGEVLISLSVANTTAFIPWSYCLWCMPRATPDLQLPLQPMLLLTLCLSMDGWPGQVDLGAWLHTVMISYCGIDWAQQSLLRWLRPDQYQYTKLPPVHWYIHMMLMNSCKCKCRCYTCARWTWRLCTTQLVVCILWQLAPFDDIWRHSALLPTYCLLFESNTSETGAWLTWLE